MIATSIDKFVPLSGPLARDSRRGAHLLQAIRSRWLTVLRLPDAPSLIDRFVRAIRCNTNNQLEAACAGKPERLGWFPERCGPQTRLPAGPPRPPKHASRAH